MIFDQQLEHKLPGSLTWARQHRQSGGNTASTTKRATLRSIFSVSSAPWTVPYTIGMRIFDRSLVRKHRDRAASGFAAHDFLVREVGERLADRLDDVTRRFPVALDLGCHTGEMADILRGRGGIETLVQCDLSPEMAARAAANGRPTLAADEEWLPFAPASFQVMTLTGWAPHPDQPKPVAPGSATHHLSEILGGGPLSGWGAGGHCPADKS